MARVLKISIQVFWTTFGALALWLLVEMAWYQIFGHPTRFPGFLASIATSILLLSMVVLFGITIYTAYVALFRFSTVVIAPTVFVISFVMFSTAMHGFNHYITPLEERRVTASPSSIMPFLVLLTLFVIVFGAFRFYRFTLAAILKMLFPGPAHLQPRSETLGDQAAFPSATWERGK